MPHDALVQSEDVGGQFAQGHAASSRPHRTTIWVGPRWPPADATREIKRLGSAHDKGAVDALNAAGRQRLAEGQSTLDLEIEVTGADGAPLELLDTKSSDCTGDVQRVSGVRIGYRCWQ